MIRDITIGQYYPSGSKLHALDPRVKIVCTLLYLISLFLFDNIGGYLVATCFLVFVIRMSKVPFKFIVRGLRPVIMLLMITVLFNLFLTRTGNILATFWIFQITDYGLKTALLMAVRLIYLILGSSLMTFTTTPNALTDGIESLLSPFQKIKLPVHEIAMMMSIALRFIPILLEETDKIMKAQIARGADLESGNIIQKAKAMIPILVFTPLVRKMVTKYGKKQLAVFGSICSVVACIAMLILPITPDNKGLLIYILCQLINSLGMGIYSTVSWGMMGDAIDYNEWKNGSREEGTVYALHSFFRKLAQGLGPAIALMIMVALGYVGANEGNQVFEVALRMRYLVAVLYIVSAAMQFIGLGLIYNLDKKTLTMMQNDLEARKKA